jgi:hypothetical protein
VILEQRGEVPDAANESGSYRIRRETVANVAPLATQPVQQAAAHAEFAKRLRADLDAPAPLSARAAYAAICLNQAQRLAKESPQSWQRARAALEQHARLLEVVAEAPTARGEEIRQGMILSGVSLPATDR